MGGPDFGSGGPGGIHGLTSGAVSPILTQASAGHT